MKKSVSVLILMLLIIALLVVSACFGIRGIGLKSVFDEDAIRKDAQSLAKLLKPQTPKSPPRSTEPAGGSSRRDALRAFTNNLMSKGE